MKAFVAVAVSLATALCFAGGARAQESEPLNISLGARLFASGWEGENEDSSDNSFEADDGGAFGLRVLLQKGRYFGGVSFQGGEYEFNDGAPDQIGDAPLPGGAVVTEDADIDRAEVDLLFGYYFWDRVALFVDIKNVTNKWQTDYSLEYGGLGAGVSAFWPLNERWTLFGTFGIVPLTIKADGDEIGDGLGSALELGLVYQWLERTNLVFGLRNQHQQYEFDNGAEQTHDIGGLAIGINHRFEVD